jgi:cytochrome c peroxidase
MTTFYRPRRKAYASLSIILVFSSLVLLSACSEDKEYSSPFTVRAIAEVQDLTGDPTTDRDLPSIADAKAQLGKKLFFTKGLGGDQDSACVSCHHPMLGGGDGLSLSIGVEAVDPDLLGPGRMHDPAGTNYDGGPTVPRNAPTTFNIGIYDQVLFHDGRVESLNKLTGFNGADNPDDSVADLGISTPDTGLDPDTNVFIADPDAGRNLPTAQARFPVTSPEEMRGFTFVAGGTNDDVRIELEAQLATLGAGNWEAEFEAVYGDPAITYARIAEAIGEYERSQVFVDNPWKAFLEGDDNTISESARRGAVLFFFPSFSGGAGCVSCHRGDFFTDEQFHVIAMPQIGRGKGDGDDGTDDFGRFRVTNVETQRYAFRTPSLLNVTETGPWGHAGGYTTLEAAVRHHLNPQTAIDNYDFSQLESSVQATNMKLNTQKAMDQLTANRAAGLFTIRDIELTDDEVADLLAFLETLTDPCIKDRTCMAPWIADCSVSDPDGLCLTGKDESGNSL